VNFLLVHHEWLVYINLLFLIVALMVPSLPLSDPHRCWCGVECVVRTGEKLTERLDCNVPISPGKSAY